LKTLENQSNTNFPGPAQYSPKAKFPIEGPTPVIKSRIYSQVGEAISSPGPAQYDYSLHNFSKGVKFF